MRATRDGNTKRLLPLLLLICVIAWLPGFFTLPALDRDESRFAQATKQMLETGDFVDINLGAGPRYEKPAGIYWMQAVSTVVFGAGVRDRIWTYRVPSVLGALAAVAATFFLVRAFAGAEAAFAAGLVLGLSALLMSESKIAKTDAVLLATVAMSQLVLTRAYLSARAPDNVEAPTLRLALAGWAAFGLGILVKGPIVALVCGLSAIAVSLWDRDVRWLRRLHALPGIGIALVIVAPWAIAIGIASHGAFYQQSLGGDFAAKILGDQEAHGAPPGYFALLAHATFWPGSLALLPAIVLGIARRKEPAVRYLLAWAVTTWLMFEFTPTKLPHYVLPAYPALAALCGLWLTTGTPVETISERIARWVSLALFLLVSVAVAVFVVWAPERFGGETPWWMYFGATIGALASLGAVLTANRKQAMAMAALSAIVLYELTGYGAVPRVPDLWLSQRLADAVERERLATDPPVVTAGYAEPSIVFLLGTGTLLENGPKAGADVASRGGLALVAETERQTFLVAVRDGGARADALGDVSGLDYSRGRAMTITLYRVTPTPK